MARIGAADPSKQGFLHGLFTRIIYSMVKRKVGRAVTPVKLVAHHRKLLWGYGQMEQSLLSKQAGGREPERPRAIARCNSGRVSVLN
jgi:hypothetical protein